MTYEESFALPTPDGKKIYGVYNRAGPYAQTDRAVIIAHGLTGHANAATYFVASRLFLLAGYDVFRPSFYDMQPDARKLTECTLQTHAADLLQVCEDVRPRYEKIFVVGHSYGGLTILLARPPAAAYSLWDPSFVPFPSFWQTDAEKVADLPYYKLNWGPDNLVGQAMYDEAKALTPAISAALAAQVTVPSQVVLAEESIERAAPMALFDALTCEKSCQTVPGSDHNFWRGDTLEDLLYRTRVWFDAH